MDKDKELFTKYPKIFKKENMVPFGGMYCEHRDGWFWLLDNLCDTIQSYIDMNAHLKIPQFEIHQVKEKFGGLRFYGQGGDTNIYGMIWFAEHLSYSICEECGKPGILRRYGWYKVRCDSCEKKHQKKLTKEQKEFLKEKIENEKATL